MSLGKLCDEKRVFLRMDQWSKTTSHQKLYSNTMQHGELRSDRGSRLVSEFFLQISIFNFDDTFKTGEALFYIFFKLIYFTNHNCVKRQWDSSTGRSEWDRFPSSTCVKFTCWTNRTEQPVVETKITVQNGATSDLPEWLQELRENLVDDRVPQRRDSHASSSHEPSLEPPPTRSVDLGKHSVYTHFPKDRNCEICQRTKINRAPCRRRIGGAVLRPEFFGDLITAVHKVLSDNCESRNNHRYAIVVQDLATQWIQLYPCKTKNFSGNTKGACKSSWSQIGKPKVIHTYNSLEFWQVLRGIILESLHVNTTQIRNTWNCSRSSAHSKGRHLCRIVAIRSEWKLVGRFQGMLYLSAKHSRYLVWWEDSIWETFWETT